jgi:hypothetical protein
MYYKTLYSRKLDQFVTFNRFYPNLIFVNKCGMYWAKVGVAGSEKLTSLSPCGTKFYLACLEEKLAYIFFKNLTEGPTL